MKKSNFPDRFRTTLWGHISRDLSDIRVIFAVPRFYLLFATDVQGKGPQALDQQNEISSFEQTAMGELLVLSVLGNAEINHSVERGFSQTRHLIQRQTLNI